MKKVILLGSIVVLVIALAIVFNFNLNAQNDKLSDFSLANVEALASGESGTSADYCSSYDSSGAAGWYYQCNSSTDAKTIYPCPTVVSYFSAGTRDRCTK